MLKRIGNFEDDVEKREEYENVLATEMWSNMVVLEDALDDECDEELRRESVSII